MLRGSFVASTVSLRAMMHTLKVYATNMSIYL